MEIVSLINAVDTTNDSAFASFVLRADGSVDSLETALGSEITARGNADTSIALRVTSAEAAIASIDTNYVHDADLVSENYTMAGFVATTPATPFSLTLANAPVSLGSIHLFVNGVRIPAPTSMTGAAVTWAGIAYAIDSSDALIITYAKA